MKMKKFIIILTVLIAMTITTNAQWQQTSLDTIDVHCLAISGSNIFAGTYNGCVYLSTNNGTSWTQVNAGLTDIWSFAISGSNIFAGTDDGVFLSTNNGSSWTAVNNGIPAYTQVNSFVISGANIFAGSDASYSANDGVFLSTNNGSSWTAVNTGLTNTYVQSLALSGTNIFAGTTSGVFLSTNNGGSWSYVSNGLSTSSPAIWALATSGNNIYAGTNGAGVYLSTNNGGSWIATNGGGTIISLLTSGSLVFVGTYNTVLLSNNTGGSWTDISTGGFGSLPNGFVGSLAIDGTYLFAGTSGNGVWKRPLSQINGIEEINQNNNITLYPNPASDIVTLNISNLNNNNGEINIYNVIGVLVRSEILKQNHQLINIDDLSNGIYMLTIKSKDYNATQKLLIQR